ncbi:MAG: exosortase/archaeosortase family protein [Myxococcales bacterium]|nr:exosortase/archaeosortase family protein [Myxococcales bacterium]
MSEPVRRWTPGFATATLVCLLVVAVPVGIWTAQTWLSGTLGGGAAGLLAVPMSTILAWLATRRPDWQTPGPDRPGAEWLLGAATLALLAALAAADAAWDALVVVGALLPVAFFAWLWGWLGLGRARLLAVPVGFTAFALPWEYFLRARIDVPLQIWSADVAKLLLDLSGHPVRIWNEYTIYDARFYVIVNETCSGMNMLVTLAMYTLVFGWVAQPSLRSRLLLFLLVVPLALLANGARIAGIHLMGLYGGQELAMGPWHTRSAYLIFLPVFWFLFVVNQALLRRAARRAAAPPPPA